MAQPLAELVPAQQVGGVAVASLLALALMLLICYGAGRLARAAVGRALSASFEDRLHAIYPRYTVIKGMAQSLGSGIGDGALKTVLVSFDEYQQLALEVERLHDGRVVVFLRGAPDPWSGSAVLVAQDRVQPVPIDVAALNKALKGIGRGSAALVEKAAAQPPDAAPALTSR